MVAMDVYHIWFNLKEGVSDIEFVEKSRTYLGHLKAIGAVAGYRITRRKLRYYVACATRPKLAGDAQPISIPIRSA
jgi:hypothetical protein